MVITCQQVVAIFLWMEMVMQFIKLNHYLDNQPGIKVLLTFDHCFIGSTYHRCRLACCSTFCHKKVGCWSVRKFQ